jgi:type II secretory pathway component GspD/PulD (secretin)
MNDCRLLNQFLVLIAMFMLGSVQASAGENADLSFSAAPVRDVYREVAEVWGLEIRFESRLKHDRLSIELTDVNALTALQELQDAAGHAIVVRDDGSLMVMDDTPQNWRTYQSLEIYTFVPRYMEVEEIDKAFRSLFEARRISPGSTSGTLTIRDTAAKICVMREYLDRLDQAPAEIDVSVRVVGSNAALQGAAQARFSADEIEFFMKEDGTTKLWNSGFTLVGHSRSMTKTEAPGDLKGQFELVVEGRHHHGSDDVTLNLDFEWTRPIGGQGGKVEPGSMKSAKPFDSPSGNPFFWNCRRGPRTRGSY